eukprot:m51a1_g4638 hypothetical protein (88) ;mRNA; f:338194-338507
MEKVIITGNRPRTGSNSQSTNVVASVVEMGLVKEESLETKNTEPLLLLQPQQHSHRRHDVQHAVSRPTPTRQMPHFTQGPPIMQPRK